MGYLLFSFRLRILLYLSGNSCLSCSTGSFCCCICLCRQNLLHLGNIHILVAGIGILLFSFLHFSFEIRLLRLFPGRLRL